MSARGPLARQTANALTSLRLVAVPFFVFFLFRSGEGTGFAALAIFLAAAATDYFDGIAARRFDARSRIGEFLDPLADKILTGSAFVSFALIERLRVPLWLVSVILAREAALTVMRSAALRGNAPLRTEFAGKAKTALQMTAIVLILALLSLEKTARFGAFAAAALGRLRVPFALTAASAAAAAASLAFYLMKNRSVFPTLPAWRKAPRGAALLVSTGCFIGFVPRAQGTIASAAGTAVWALFPPGPAYALLCGAVALAAWLSSGYAEKRIFRTKDPPSVVIDEIAGAMATFLTFSFSASLPGFLTCALGFLLFRVFDILKPVPVRLLQRLEGGAGIILDDLAAAAFANAGLQILRLLARL